MAVITNTFQSTSAVGVREELSDVVSRITPEDTPIYSMVEKVSFDTKHPEWETDALAAPGANAQLEGDDYTFGSTTPPTRLGNYTQIMRKEGIISGTQEEQNEAGNVQKVKYQKLKKGVELRKDVEFAIVSNTASVSGTTRYFGSLPSWPTSNVSRNSGSNGGFSSGSGLTVAETTGTQRAFTKTLLDTVMQSCFNSGANITDVVVSPYVKSVFVTFMSDSNVAPFRMAVDAGGKRTIIATADYYEGPFGRVAVIPNRVAATSAAVARRVHLLDDEMLAMKVLRKMAADPSVITNADSEAGVIIGEHTLCVRNEAGLGCIADVYGLSAST